MKGYLAGDKASVQFRPDPVVDPVPLAQRLVLVFHDGGEGNRLPVHGLWLSLIRSRVRYPVGLSHETRIEQKLHF